MFGKILNSLRILAGDVTERKGVAPSTTHLTGSEEFATRSDGTTTIEPTRGESVTPARRPQRNPVP